MQTNLLCHLNENQLICAQQHGFVPRRSCTTNLLETIDFTTFHLSKKTPVDVVFLDFAKAFDKVSHPLLLHKLAAYGVRGQMLNWLRAFLSGRRQRVVLGNSSSEWCEVLSGVPQGSVLGPLLFVLFINDLPAVIHSTCKLFADDCKILATVKEPGDYIRLQRDIDAVVKWCDEWSMQLNFDKCRVMHCGKRNP